MGTRYIWAFINSLGQTAPSFCLLFDGMKRSIVTLVITNKLLAKYSQYCWGKKCLVSVKKKLHYSNFLLNYFLTLKPSNLWKQDWILKLQLLSRSLPMVVYFCITYRGKRQRLIKTKWDNGENKLWKKMRMWKWVYL